MDRPRFSIIIPTYNGADVLGEQLQSLISQSIPVPELVVSDNGSSDRSRQVALSFAERLPVRVVDTSERSGNAAARNLGAEQKANSYSSWTRTIAPIPDGPN